MDQSGNDQFGRFGREGVTRAHSSDHDNRHYLILILHIGGF
jgi:hypothetical protein